MAVSGVHPLAGTIAAWMWLLPLLPLIGFVVNGALCILSKAHIGPADPDIGHDDQHAAASQSSHATDDSHAHGPPKFASLVTIIGPGVLLVSFLLAAAMFFAMRGVDMSTPFVQRYWSWMPVGALKVDFAFQLDQLSMVMVLIITGVGTLIHIFSVGYMREDPGYARFFAYLNLFVFFMLILVLGANYPILFVGWEGVGLCSYLLVGFWFLDKANADAGKKAFIVN